MPMRGVEASEKHRDKRLRAVDEALSALREHDPELGRLFEYRFFAGLSLEDAGRALGMSPLTARKRWSTAKAYLLGVLEAPDRH